jgi:hypothetical protein
MRCLLFLVMLSELLLCAVARAMNYPEVDRRIAKEPTYHSRPQYALLLFGQEAKLRVWVVLDGQTLYLDRNADGDLTSQDERFARIEDCREVEIHDPDKKTSYLIRHVQRFKDRESNRESLMVDTDIKGPLHYRQYCDVELKERAGEAKIAHFDGPLTMGPRTVDWKAPAHLALVMGDKPTDLQGGVGTMDAEHGCWVMVRSHQGDKSAFPDGVFPILEVQFPPKRPGDPPLKKQYQLDKFC